MSHVFVLFTVGWGGGSGKLFGGGGAREFRQKIGSLSGQTLVGVVCSETKENAWPFGQNGRHGVDVIT